MSPWFWESAGSEDENQNSKEVLSTLLFFFLLMPLGVTFLIWKEATHLLIALRIRPLTIKKENSVRIQHNT